ncbi:hypothetical protein AYM40_29295 [Paraburkholderia phytofirmans OLGA172]|uniref:Periplasmic binding protein domain-containing protein n=1 Tax=Paraburkholderia phytofirmans OLGA172 TaxID=1417228 RepID=A0A160FTN3_9BURK|nr:substrate-binding domain-containing protein [Paraburkholderia phytofirmans]ANB76342.1 hypothetical protein AYM40_29295 [Paraburkholderia phytofirmans OLGA172]
MRCNRTLFKWLLIATALLMGAGGARATDIGATLAGTRSEFWKAMENGIAQAGTDLGVNVLVRSPMDDDPQTAAKNVQLKMVRSLIASGAKAIVLAPIPVIGLKTPVELPVPVVFIDRPSNDFHAISTVCTDNYAAGRAAALTLKGHLAPGAKVAVLRLSPDVVSTTSRENGFIDAARQMGFEVVIDTFIGHGIHEPQVAAEDAIKAYGRPIDAIFTPTDFTTVAAVRAVDELALSKRPKLVGFDYRPIFRQYLHTGELYAFVVQDAYRMGYVAVQTLVQFRAHQQVLTNQTIETIVVTGANIDDPTVLAKLKQYEQ